MTLCLYQELETPVNGVEVEGETLQTRCYRAESRTGEIIMQDRRDNEITYLSPFQGGQWGFLVENVSAC